jgi:hypothetical protein
VKGWQASALDELAPEVLPDFDSVDIPGPQLRPLPAIFSSSFPEGWSLIQHGFPKAAMMLLGLPHVQEGDDLVVLSGWEALLEAFGFGAEGEEPLRKKDAKKVVNDRIATLRDAKELLDEERERLSILENERPSESHRRQVRASADLALPKPIRWGVMLRLPSSTKVQEIRKATSLLNEWRTNWLLMVFFPWSVHCLISAGNTALRFELDAGWGGQKRRLLVS